MLNQEAVNIALQKIKSQEIYLLAEVQKEKQQALEELSNRGMLTSSTAHKQFAAILIECISQLAENAWEILKEALNDAGSSYYEGMAEEIKNVVFDLIPEKPELVDPNLASSYKIIGLQNEAFMDNHLKRAFRNTTQKIGAEIDGYVFHLKHKKEPTPTTNVHVTAHDGVTVQVGNHNVANVNQRWGAEDLKGLADIFTKLEREITAVQDVSQEIKDEILEIAGDVKNELAKDNPNQSKLKSFLLGIATTIQTIPALKQALDWFGPAIATLMG